MPDENGLDCTQPLAEECVVSEDFEPLTGVTTPVTPETRERTGVDLTQGSLLRGIVMLSWPIVTGAFLNWIMGVADIKMVGRLGPEAIAAVGLAQPVIYTILAIIFAVATGTQVLVARYTGAKQRDRVAEVTRQTIIVSVLAGLVLIPIGRWLAEPALRLMGAEGLVLQYGVAYTRIFFWGSVGLMVNMLMASALQGAGDTLTPMLMLIWINVSHIALGYMLIFGKGPFPAMGVAGSAWGVVASRGLAALIMLWMVTSGRFAVTVPLRHSWRIDWAIWRKMFGIGIPSSLQGLVRNIATATVSCILIRTAVGFYAVAANTASSQWGMLGVFVGLAMMTSAMTAVGQNMGAEQPDRAERSCWSVVWISAISCGVLSALCIIFSRPLIAFFTTDAQTMYWGWWALVILAASLPFATVAMAFSGALRGAGDTWSPLWAAVIGMLVLGPGVAYLLALVLHMGPIGAWLGLALSMVAQAFFTGAIFKRGRWKKIVI